MGGVTTLATKAKEKTRSLVKANIDSSTDLCIISLQNSLLTIVSLNLRSQQINTVLYKEIGDKR